MTQNVDICRSRLMTLRATYVELHHMSTFSEICRSERDMSLGARYVARPEICRSVRDMSLKVRYVACSEISRKNEDMSRANICRGERHKSKMARYLEKGDLCRLRHISLPSDMTRAERHKSMFSDICRLGRPRKVLVPYVSPDAWLAWRCGPALASLNSSHKRSSLCTAPLLRRSCFVTTPGGWQTDVTPRERCG